jgi:DNA/RNA-binding domain of Phe-tRNA-synthetase-like protein
VRKPVTAETEPDDPGSAPPPELPTLELSRFVRDRYSEFRALVLYVDRLQNAPSTAVSRQLLTTCAAEVRTRFAYGRAAEHPHIVAWREVYRSFGAKPSRYHCSAEALLRRALKGDKQPEINAIVDTYNAISMRWAIPIGGEDRSGLSGNCVLRAATGAEPFVAFHERDETIVHPCAGEIVWSDDEGVTCRRWNWRQCARTQLTEATTSAYFLLEALPPFGSDELRHAGEDLARELTRTSPKCRIEVHELGAGA